MAYHVFSAKASLRPVIADSELDPFEFQSNLNQDMKILFNSYMRQ